MKPLVSVLEEIHNPTEERHETVTNTSGQTAQAGWRAIDRLTETNVADLVKRYQEGATLSGLAEQYKIGRGAVRRLLQREEVELRRRGLTSEQIDEATRLYDLGWSLAKIGDRMGVNATTVHTRLRERGVQTRNAQGQRR